MPTFTNDYLAFAAGVGSDNTPQDQYVLADWRVNGWRSGILPHQQINKVLRQTSVMSAALAQTLVDTLGVPMADDGNISALSVKIRAAFSASGTPFDPNGTYPPGSIGAFLQTLNTSGAAWATPDALKSILLGALTESQLTSSLNNRLNLIDAAGTGLVTKVADLQTAYGSTTSAAASASTAATKAAEAVNSANIAATKAGEAFTSATNANNSATSATTAAGTATTKAGEASTSASSAAGSASTASTQASAAANSASNASGSASAASTSATNASTSSGQAGTYASTAQSAAGTATTKAGEASTSATSAATSATTATGASSTASTQAGLAASSASAANTSAGQAGTSAGQAATSASNASGSASSAGTSATAAASSATSASNSASAAAGSASTASSSATTAGNSASAANSSAVAASSSAGAASTSAGQAASSATNAAGSATSAASWYSQTVSATGGLTSAISQEAQTRADADGVLGAQYVLKVSTTRSDGKQVFAGLGLAASTVGNISQSEILMVADRLVFATPGDENGTITPLMTVGTSGGVSNQVIIRQAIIGDLTVATLKIANNAVTVPIYWELGADVSYTGSGGEQTLLTAVSGADFKGAPIYCNAVFSYAGNSDSLGNGQWTLRVRVDGVQAASWTLGTVAPSSSFGGKVGRNFQVAGSGSTRTVSITIQPTSNLGWGTFTLKALSSTYPDGCNSLFMGVQK